MIVVERLVWHPGHPPDGLTFRCQMSRASLPASLRLSRFNSLIRRTKSLALFHSSIREKWIEMLRNLSLLFMLLTCFSSQFVGERDRSLIVQIKVNQTQVTNKEQFAVAATIRNTGATQEVLQIWACSFPSEWVSDNKDVYVHQVNCVQDSMTKIKLGPGETWKRSLPVYIQLPSNQTGPKPLTFRLGFGNSFHFGSQRADQQAQAIWSNAVTVTVSM